MKASNDIHDFETLLDNTFGHRGTVERDELETNAQAFCVGQMIVDARKQEHMTQAELAQRIGSSKSYISKIENGYVDPSASLFLKIITALGLRFELVKPYGVLL